MSRVRGLLLERTGEREGVVLTPDGQFVRARIVDEGEYLPGVEVWGIVGPAPLGERVAAFFGSWRRTAAATALAFGVVGAVFAAVYLRGGALPPMPGTAVVPGAGSPAATPMPGEGTADAESKPVRALASESPPVAPAPSIRLSERMDAPQLSARTDFSGWSNVRMRIGERAASGRDATDIVEQLRRALLSGRSEEDRRPAARGGPAATSGTDAPVTPSKGPDGGTAGGDASSGGDVSVATVDDGASDASVAGPKVVSPATAAGSKIAPTSELQGAGQQGARVMDATSGSIEATSGGAVVPAEDASSLQLDVPSVRLRGGF
ncbi:MAG: hypothetical protein IMX02_05110 [Limnochordaceae bacterium]|nr:hypothetical protein [Limnochordaceae bacterium]